MTSALSGQKVRHYGQNIVEWSLLACLTSLGCVRLTIRVLGPTIFTIFFAAIIGSAMKFIAQYKLERGASIDVSAELQTEHLYPVSNRI